MINFDYACDKCGNETTTQEMDSMLCACGGSYRLNSFAYRQSAFEPHYAPEIKQFVTSWKDAEKKGRAYRSPDHPNGFILANENKKFLSDMRYLRKHKEDYKQQIFAKDGYRYRPGSGDRFDDKTRSFVPNHTR